MNFTDTLSTKISFKARILQCLDNPKKMRTIWIVNVVFTLILTAFFGSLLGVVNNFSSANSIVALNSYSFYAIRIVCITSLVLIYFPYALMVILFLVGIVQLHKSLLIHYLIWFFSAVALVFLIAMCISVGVIFAPWDHYVQAQIFN